MSRSALNIRQYLQSLTRNLYRLSLFHEDSASDEHGAVALRESMTMRSVSQRQPDTCYGNQILLFLSEIIGVLMMKWSSVALQA